LFIWKWRGAIPKTGDLEQARRESLDSAILAIRDGDRDQILAFAATPGDGRTLRMR
jgi:hypothetical protein